MIRSRDFPLGRKLLALTVLPSLLALLGSGVYGALREARQVQRAEEESNAEIATLLEHELVLSAVGETPEQLERRLERFGVGTRIVRAAFFDPAGQPLARYGEDPGPESPLAPGTTRATAGRGLEIRTLQRAAQPTGTLVLEFESRTAPLGAVLAPFFGLAGVLAFLTAVCHIAGLRRLVMRPLADLALAQEGEGPVAGPEVRGDHGFAELARALNRSREHLEERRRGVESALAEVEAESERRAQALHGAKQDLSRAQRSAEAAEEARTRFLANMSHEIRTPMNGILGMNELLLESPLEGYQRGYAEIVQNSAEALLELVGDILDYSKIESGSVQIGQVEFEIPRLLEDVTRLLRPQAERKGLQLVCTVDPGAATLVRGDPGRLRQVLVNLVGNAIKFTDLGSVLLGVSEGDAPGHLEFTIQDSGIGFPEGLGPKLFQPFSQVDESASRRFGGMGLGLAIVGELVSMMGGAIDLDSQPGQGTTVRLALPFERLAGDRGVTEPLTLNGRPCRALLVDARASALEALHQQFTAWRVDHVRATSLEEALAELRSLGEGEGLDLVVLDEDLYQRSRARDRVELQQELSRIGLPVVLLHREQHSRVAPVLPVPARRVVKPFRPELLQGALAELLEERVEPRSPGQERPSPGTLASRLRVLLAEDNRINQRVAKQILARGGIECDIVEDGQAALEAHRKKPYDVILMDCQMPRLDGYGAARRLRELERQGQGERVRIIALTANAMSGDRERCLDAGMDDYLGKPVRPDKLLARMAEVAEAKHSELSQRGGPRPYSSAESEMDLAQRFQGKADELMRELGRFEGQSIAVMDELSDNLGARRGPESLRAASRLREALELVRSEPVQALANALHEELDAGRFEEAEARLGELQVQVSRWQETWPELLRQVAAS